MGYQRTICDGLPKVPCGSNTTCAAFSVRVLVGMAAIVVIVVKQVNGAKSVHGRAFTRPLHRFLHSWSPVTSNLALNQNRVARLAPVQRQRGISAAPGFKTNAEPNLRQFHATHICPSTPKLNFAPVSRQKTMIGTALICTA
jgi:hypothetical protein